MTTSSLDDFIGTKFGAYNQLEVVAWCGQRSGSNKKYTIFCSICAEDPELFGFGLFLITKSKLNTGRIPCGCSKSRNWSEAEYLIRVRRESFKRDYEFLGWAEDYSGVQTKLHLRSEFGESKSATISSFLSGVDCWVKRNFIVGALNTKDNSYMLAKFMKTGSYAEGTIFERSNRCDKYGWRTFWNVTCGHCNESYQAMLSNLSAGHRGCSCSLVRHVRAYIHQVSLNGQVIGVKYGITSHRSQVRLYSQSRKSPCDLLALSTWCFEKVSDCRRAEAECKRAFKSFISKENLPDGYTETAPFSCVQEIINIYEKHGGVKDEQL